MPTAVERRIAGTLTKEQVEAWEASQKSLYGKESDGGAVKRELPRLKATMEQETYRRLLPGYVGRFLENAAPLVDIGIEGDIQGFFALRPLKPGRLDWLLPCLERYRHKHAKPAPCIIQAVTTRKRFFSTRVSQSLIASVTLSVTASPRMRCAGLSSLIRQSNSPTSSTWPGCGGTHS